MLAYIIQGVVYGFAAAAQPGPFQTYLISQTLTRGWRCALPMVAAPLLSDGPILALVVLVLSRAPAWWVQSLQVAGGVFVLYLAAGAWRSWRRHDAIPDAEAPGGRLNVYRAALVNVLSPAPYLFWSLATGPILLTGWRKAPVNGIGMLVGFYLTMMAACTAIIVLFAGANRLGVRVTRGLQLLSAAALGGFGLYRLAAGVWACWRP